MEITSKERTLCLETLREGAAVERFNDELRVVFAVMGLTTSSVDVTFSLVPQRSEEPCWR